MMNIKDIRGAIHTINMIDDTIRKLEQMIEANTTGNPMKESVDNTVISHAILLLSQYMEDIQNTPIK